MARVAAGCHAKDLQSEYNDNIAVSPNASIFRIGSEVIISCKEGMLFENELGEII